MVLLEQRETTGAAKSDATLAQVTPGEVTGVK